MAFWPSKSNVGVTSDVGVDLIKLVFPWVEKFSVYVAFWGCLLHLASLGTGGADLGVWVPCVIGLVGPVKTEQFLQILPSKVQRERVSDTCVCPRAKAVKPRADRRVWWWREPNIALGWDAVRCEKDGTPYLLSSFVVFLKTASKIKISEIEGK